MGHEPAKKGSLLCNQAPLSIPAESLASLCTRSRFPHTFLHGSPDTVFQLQHQRCLLSGGGRKDLQGVPQARPWGPRDYERPLMYTSMPKFKNMHV